MENDIIRGSSYLLFEGSPKKGSPIDHIPGQIGENSKTVTFYTFDGEPIITVEHNSNFDSIKSKLDPFALPPKPVSYKRVWVPSFKFNSETLVEAGYLVFFHDKNHNRFSWEVLNSEGEYIDSWMEYDLTHAFEEEPDFSLKGASTDCNIGTNTFIIEDYNPTLGTQNEPYAILCRKSVICSNKIGDDLTISMLRISDSQEQCTDSKPETTTCVLI